MTVWLKALGLPLPIAAVYSVDSTGHLAYMCMSAHGKQPEQTG